MGIKSIKSVENNLTVDPIFELQGMVKIRKEPISYEYELARRIGAGTYGEVFEAVHQSTGQRRAVKKINTFKFPRAKTMTLSEVSLLKRMVLARPRRYGCPHAGPPQHPQDLRGVRGGGVRVHRDGVLRGEGAVRHHRRQALLPRGGGLLYLLRGGLGSAGHARQPHHAPVPLRPRSDLKPENIMYDEKKKNLKIIDFGSGVRF
jgi:hypothetical protein